MNSHDETKLTAYALGELSEGDRAEVEAYLANDEAARREVEEIRKLAGVLTSELAAEIMPMPAAAPASAPAETKACPERLKINARRKSVGRLAVAAAACVVVGGITAAV